MGDEKLHSGEESEEIAAPHLTADATPEGEVWTAAPFLDPSAARPLTPEEKWPGEWHAICWMYAHGSSQNQIAAELNYSVSRISIILSKPQVHEKIEQIRREFLGTENLQKKFAVSAQAAVAHLTKVIDGSTSSRSGERLDASKWMLEKVTGKPKQEGAQDSGTTILQLLQALDAVKAASAPQDSRTVSEDAPDLELMRLPAPPPPDPLADWVRDHVPELKSEKTQHPEGESNVTEDKE